MTGISLASSNQNPLWAWPIDPGGYDRTPSLSSKELTALDIWISQREREHGSHIPQHVRVTLHRLVCPLSDVLTVTGADGAIRRGTVRFFLHWMLSRQSTFWA
jgi:hypothetical protein